MNCATTQALKADYLRALAREQATAQAERQAVTQMQREIAKTQVKHSAEDCKRAKQLLLDHCLKHRCGGDLSILE